MNRRQALKFLGAFVMMLGAGRAKAEEKLHTDEVIDWWKPKPMSYTITEDIVNNIIIERPDGTKLIIPFSEIVEALQNGT